MDITNKQYDKLVKQSSPPSRVVRNCIFAFVTGGLICTVAQVINNIFTFYDFEKTQASAYTSICMIFIGAILTGFNVYDNIAVYGGAGTLVPITGFANSIVSPAMEFKTEGMVMGVGANMFRIAGPVIVYGVGASVIYGIVYYLIR